MTSPVEVFAPAKINLTLHVTGQLPDGYHLLDSLVVFASIGDRIAVRPAEGLSLTIDGPFAKGLSADSDNLVLRAARMLSSDRGAAITLTKHLPLASGIGGGSADAAATLRALAELWGLPLPDDDLVSSLGADVPVCLDHTPCRMSGVGDQLAPVPTLPDMDILLVNPGVPMPTPDVFRALTTKTNPPMAPELPDWPSLVTFADWLGGQRNDLQPPAIKLQPVIADVLEALRSSPGCLYAGMSGSGATCFGLFPPNQLSSGSAIDLKAQSGRPDWWTARSQIL